VVTYDPEGGYGHPDHIQTHRVTTEAVAAAADDGYPGEPWQVPKFYWTVISRSAMNVGLKALANVPDSWITVDIDDVPLRFPDDKIDAAVDAGGQRDAKIAALRAHATQVTVAPNDSAFALSNNIALPIHTEEHYVLVSGEPGERDSRGWETDLLAGLDLG